MISLEHVIGRGAERAKQHAGTSVHAGDWELSRAAERSLVGAILMTAVLLRLFKISSFALWFDESASWTISQYPWSTLFAHVRDDIGPPLYFVVLKLWTSAFGQSLLMLRALSLVFDVLAVAACYGFVKRVYDARTAWISTVLVAVNPFQIQYSRETRMYTMGVCLVLVSSRLLVEAIRSGRRSRWAWYGLSAAACIYTHYYLAFSILAQGLTALIWALRASSSGLRERWLQLAFAYGVAFVAFVPWLPAFLVQGRQVQQSFWIPPITAEQVLRFPWTLMLGGSDSAWTPTAWLWVWAGVFLLVGAKAVIAARDWRAWLIVLQAIVPIAAGLALSIQRPSIVDRYFLFASTFWSIVFARAIATVRPITLSRALAGAAVLMSVAAAAKNLNAVGVFSIRHPADRPGMAAAAAVVNASARPDDRIVIAHSLIYFPFRYYNRTSIDPRLFDTDSVENIPVYAGRSMLTESDVIHRLDAVSARRVWFLWTDGFYQRKPPIPGNWHLEAARQFEDAPSFKGTIHVEEYRTN